MRVIILALLAGCGTQSGTEKPDDLEDPCLESETELALDEVTPLGFAAADVLPWVEAGMSAPLTWSDGATTELRLGFSAIADATAWYQDFEQDPEVDAACEATDAVWIPVEWSVETTGGEVDASGSYGVRIHDAASGSFLATVGGYGSLAPECDDGQSDPELEIDTRIASDGTAEGWFECGSTGFHVATW